MRTSLRRQLRLLQAHAAISFCALVFLSLTAFSQTPAPQKIDELTVQRLNALPAGPDRDAAVKAARAKAPAGPTRLFAGKTPDRAAQVGLSDANGKPRLVLKVEGDGTASIDFLDADGKTVQRIPSK